MSKTRFSIEAIFNAIDKFSGPVARMTTRMDRFTRRVRKGMGGMAKMTKRVSRGMRTMSLTIGSLAVLGGYALRGLIGPAAKFEQAMAGVNAVMLGGYKWHMPALAQKAKDLGRTTIFTATQVGEAMEIMARAGLSPDSITSGIKPILDAAAAEGAGIQETAKVIISSMKGFEKGFEHTTRIADVFAYVSSKAKTNINALGEGLSKVAPVAKMFDLDMEHMIATVATLQDVGVEASMSGTQLKTMLSKFADLSPKAAQGFRRLGIEIMDGNKNMKQMPELIDAIFTGLLKTKGNVAKVKAIVKAVGLRGSTAANILAGSWGKGRQGLQGLLKGVAEEADDAADKMNRLRQDTLLGDITKLKSAFEGFRIDMVADSLPELRKTVQALTDWFQSPDNIKAAAEKFDTAVLGLKSFWSQNGSTIKDMADTILTAATLTWETAKMIYDIGDAIKPDDILGRTLGTPVDDRTRNEHLAYESGGPLPEGASATSTVMHMGQVHDVVNSHGILHIELSDELKPKSDARGEIGIGPFSIELPRTGVSSGERLERLFLGGQ